MRHPAAASTSLSSRKFCDYVAHELANPLNGMLMSAEVIEKYVEADPRAMDEIGDLTQMLRKEIKRLIILLKELRASRVLACVNLSPTSLPPLIRETLAVQSESYRRRGIRIEESLPLELPRLMADKIKIQQAFLNLCKNAVEAMPDGGVLTLRAYATEHWVCLDISDTGNGIPETLQIFEPDITNKPNGAGLGLAIVREIVQQHNGEIAYETSGKGTTFHIKFPLRSE
jgi:signal transduction histidine kinase